MTKYDMQCSMEPKSKNKGQSKFDQINDIIDLTLDHESRPVIAEKVGCCKTTVYKIQSSIDLI